MNPMMPAEPAPADSTLADSGPANSGPADSETKARVVTVMTVTVDGRSFALPLAAVTEVVEPGPVTPVPLAPPAAAGLINLHGRPTLAVDLGRWLGLGGRMPAMRRRAVIVEHDGLSCGILVDGLGAVGTPGQDDPLPVIDLPRLLTLEPPGDPALNQPPGDAAARPRPVPPEPQDPVPPPPPRPDPDPVATEPEADASLHDRLGGRDGIREAVARLARRVAADPLLTPFAAGIDPARLQALAADFFAMAFGGPADYAGPPLAAIQARLAQAGFGAEQEEAVLLHLRHALLELAVDEDAANEAAAALQAVWSDLLGRPV